MDRPWEAERAVTEAEARALILEQFPALAPARIEAVGVGWDNTVFRVNANLVFRFPRRRLAVELIGNEERALRAIAGRLPLPIPVPLHHGEPTSAYPWPFLGYAWLPGETGCRADLKAEERARIAAPLGEFLAALHACPASELRHAGVGPDTLGRLALPHRRQQIEARLADAGSLGLVEDSRDWDCVLADLPEAWQPGSDTLVHGDFYSCHVLVDDQRRLSGVIDWGDVHLGEPALDVSIAWGFLPSRARAAFRAAYGPISADAWRMARMKALHNAVMILVYGHDVRDVALMREGRLALAHVLQG